MGAGEPDVTGGAFFLVLVGGMFFPIIALIAAIWLALQGQGGLALFALVWWFLWSGDDEYERRNS